MYTATMQYHFKPGCINRGVELWKEEILEHAALQPGFVRMQLLVAGEDAMAIGTWEAQADAQAFMQTGVFQSLLARLEDMLAERPVPRVWDLRLYTEQS